MFHDLQAEAILGLTLRRLTALEDSKLQAEHASLSLQIAALTRVMQEDAEVLRVIKHEALEVRAAHAVPRRTAIAADSEAEELSEKDLLANDRSVVLLTASGYLKRMPLSEFEAQHRGGRGKLGTSLAGESDAVLHFFACHDHDTVLFITSRCAL